MAHRQLPDYLPSATKFALTVALGCAYILKPILDFINGMSPRSPVLDAAVAVVLVTLPATYIMGVILLYLLVTPQAAAARGAPRRFADLACTLAFALLVALAAFLFLAVAHGSPAPTGLKPTI